MIITRFNPNLKGQKTAKEIRHISQSEGVNQAFSFFFMECNFLCAICPLKQQSNISAKKIVEMAPPIQGQM